MPFAVIVRVRPSRGRIVELWLRFQQTDFVHVEPGDVDVDAVLSSGETFSKSVHVAPGTSVPVNIVVAPSAGEAMHRVSRWALVRWIPYLVGAALGLTTNLALYFLTRASITLVSIIGGVTALSAGAVFSSLRTLAFHRIPMLRRLQVTRKRPTKILQAYGSPVRTIFYRTYNEGRILHLRDGRSVEQLRNAPRSGIAFLVVREWSSRTCRVCALPGPWRAPHAEVHVVIRDSEMAPGGEIQVWPANHEIADIIGFLERRDQRALSVISEHVASATSMLADKLQDPIPAAIGLALLLRVGAPEHVQGWSRSLWRRFPGLPDAAALHAAVMLREPSESSAWGDEFRRAVLSAALCGVPMLTESLRRLHDAIRALEDIQKLPLPEVARWCTRMLRAADPNAVFTTLTLQDDELDAVFGTRGASSEALR